MEVEKVEVRLIIDFLALRGGNLGELGENMGRKIRYWIWVICVVGCFNSGGVWGF